ncbi:protein fem-1 homolog CG6966-like isoform X3 [Daphnia pulicaria]|uniref:protein fem-1 homolog CG6966-like isoform X3 n=1 Tax=Daphnia pulicaria TaxID=35523 RepID=UPI001EE9E93A|nr:protein fem-1 homolog CG6966-like isoform X3 [Daphnia pulicaria]
MAEFIVGPPSTPSALEQKLQNAETEIKYLFVSTGALAQGALHEDKQPKSVVGHCRGRGVQLIQLLLDAGADPHTISRKGKTPFHWLFEGWSAYEPYEFKMVFKALMEAGGHVDQVNKDGDSALSLIIDWRTSTLPFGDLVRDPYFDSIIYSVLPLSCSCAQVIGENQIPFENLPSRLKSFVLRHSAIKVT